MITCLIYGICSPETAYVAITVAIVTGLTTLGLAFLNLVGKKEE